MGLSFRLASLSSPGRDTSYQYSDGRLFRVDGDPLELSRRKREGMNVKARAAFVRLKAPPNRPDIDAAQHLKP